MNRAQWIKNRARALNIPIYVSRNPDKTKAAPAVRFIKGDTAPAADIISRGGNLWYDENTNELKYLDPESLEWIIIADKDETSSLLESATIEGYREFINQVTFRSGINAPATTTITQLGDSVPATADFQFISAAVVDATINLVAANSLSVTYEGKTDGTTTNGFFNSGSGFTEFNVG